MEMVQNGQNGRKMAKFKLAQKWMKLGGDVPPTMFRNILKIW